MKKKHIANAVMVVVILLIVGLGTAGAGYVLGWFDKEGDSTTLLTDIRGIVQMQRNGVVYTVEKPIVLHEGDVLTCEKGATVSVQAKNSTVVIGEGAKITVTDANADTLTLAVDNGELMANCSAPITITLDGTAMRMQETVAHVSMRSGVYSVSVFSGTVETVCTGQKLEYVSGETTVAALQIDAMNAFTIAQLRAVNETKALWFTNAQLDALEEQRNQALQDAINGALGGVVGDDSDGSGNSDSDAETHEHAYRIEMVNPTCTAGGYTVYHCDCGDRYTDHAVQAKGHSWGNWITAVVPTVQKEGVDRRTCDVCQQTEDRAIAKLQQSHAHSYTEKVIAPNCVAGGYTLFTCSCGTSYKDRETAALGHSYTSAVTVPTCSVGGYTTYTCACGDRYIGNATAAKGHNWSSWVTVTAATEKKEGLERRTCAVCREKEDRTVAKIVHTHAYSVQIVAPACTTGGYTVYTCTCGDTYTKDATAAKGHSWGNWITVIAPTVQKEGLDRRTCTTCQTAEERTIAKLQQNHTHQYTQQVVAPTCTVAGYTLHTCSCGTSYKDRETAALGHSYTANVVAPTCTTTGYTTYTCTCGDRYTGAETAAIGHNWSDWETVKQPTTSQTGLKKRTCTNCNAGEEKTIDKLAQTVDGYVYITIRCDTILNNWDELNPAKAEFVPADGVILPMVKVGFAQGETVFDVLVRVCEAMSIQVEYSWVPLYDGYYIEGINNLYQFDCSSESGWMYQVDGWFPNYGVSQYTLQNNNVIQFLFTCHGYGTDVGAPEWEG